MCVVWTIEFQIALASRVTIIHGIRHQWDAVGTVFGVFLLRRGFCAGDKDDDGGGDGDWVVSDTTNILVVIMMVVVVVMQWG